MQISKLLPIPRTHSAGLLLLIVLSCNHTAAQLDKVGLQLWSVRSAMETDFTGTLAKIADAGFDQVEFAGYYQKDPAEIKGILDSLGLTAPAAHLGYDQLSGKNFTASVEAAKIIGHNTLILPSLPRLETTEGEQAAWDDVPETREAVLKIAALFNEIGRACQKEGLRFAFHNHRNEFKTVDSGEVIMDILLRETDPSLVDFELDIGWAVAAGADPLAYLANYPGRFTYLHIKDMDAGNQSVVVGKGTIDFVKILAAAKKAGSKYYIVEYEGKKDPVASSAASVKYLKALKF